MASIVLGIMGKKRSGKDTFAARLVSKHGYTRLAFADALKESLLELDPYVSYFPGGVRLSAVVNDVGWDAAKQIPEVRALLQRHGVAMRNHVGEDVWVDAVEGKIRCTFGPVVITDVRFPNEANMIEESFGGTLVRIFRDDLVSNDTHISENALNDRDPEYIIENNADVAALHHYADSLAATLSPFGGY